jgi:hypothetical protein
MGAREAAMRDPPPKQPSWRAITARHHNASFHHHFSIVLYSVGGRGAGVCSRARVASSLQFAKRLGNQTWRRILAQPQGRLLTALQPTEATPAQLVLHSPQSALRTNGHRPSTAMQTGPSVQTGCAVPTAHHFARRCEIWAMGRPARHAHPPHTPHRHSHRNMQ